MTRKSTFDKVFKKRKEIPVLMKLHVVELKLIFLHCFHSCIHFCLFFLCLSSYHGALSISEHAQRGLGGLKIMNMVLLVLTI